jgi:hypothetical protein
MWWAGTINCRDKKISIKMIATKEDRKMTTMAELHTNN